MLIERKRRLYTILLIVDAVLVVSVALVDSAEPGSTVISFTIAVLFAVTALLLQFKAKRVVRVVEVTLVGLLLIVSVLAAYRSLFVVHTHLDSIIPWIALISLFYFTALGSRMGLWVNVVHLGANLILAALHTGQYPQDWFDFTTFHAAHIAALAFGYLGSDLIERYNSNLEKLARTDPLTGLPNRRALYDAISNEIERAFRYDRPFSIVMIDIDCFKSINDTHGHQVGDQVITTVIDKISDGLRGADVLGRWGGEEFLLLLPETPVEGAAELAERLRANIESQLVTEVGTVTSSFGIAEYQHGNALKTLLSRADEALYAAKKNGRNRVEVV